MLQAYIHHKIENEKVNNSNSVRLKPSEDSITSCVFERLVYLPSNLLLKLLNAALDTESLSKYETSNLQEVDFWPKWNPENTTNNTFVEPDVFMRFDDFDLIIESKINRSNRQSIIQWENEIRGYRNEFSDDKKVFLLAVDGVENYSSEMVDGVKIIKTNWNKIIQSLKIELMRIDDSSMELYHQSLIINDILASFRLHGYATGEWFKTINRSCIRRNDLELWNVPKVK